MVVRVRPRARQRVLPRLLPVARVQLRTRDLAGFVACDLHKRVQEGLQVAFTSCGEQGCALTEVQRIELQSVMSDSLDGLRESVRSHIEFAAMLDGMRDDGDDDQ